MSSAGWHRIHIRKEALKFAAAHMTVFADGSKERLHGHNYRTELTIDLRDCSLPRMLPFHELKAAMHQICQTLDERVLLAAHCPFLEVNARDSSDVELAFSLCNKRYVLPRDEVVLLPIDNITTEGLAAHFFAQLYAHFGEAWFAEKGVLRIAIRIDEISGQGASYIREFAPFPG